MQANIRRFTPLFITVIWLFNATAQPLSPNNMRVHYINVGQAASALLEFSCGTILIDARYQDNATHEHLLTMLKSIFAQLLGA